MTREDQFYEIAADIMAGRAKDVGLGEIADAFPNLSDEELLEVHELIRTAQIGVRW